MMEPAPVPTPDVAQLGALWFGRDGASAFGMVHRPDAPSTRGVIFCNALGFEGLLAHRAFRHLADELTGRGFWSLRFDYYGEGDSAGGPWDGARVDAWMASIDAAVGVLRARGVTDIRLVGFRMGASLASMYATSHPGISSVVLWSPCAKGKAYAREMKALSRLSAVARPTQRVTADWFPDDALEVAGFELAGETLRAFAEMDLVAAPVGVTPPAMLVIDRDDAPGNDDLVQKYMNSGVRVDHDRMPGYEDFMTDSEQSSVVPWSILKRIEGWLDETNPPAMPPPVADIGALLAVDSVEESETLAIDDPAAGLLALDGPARDRVVEQPVWIDGRLFAVISTPAGDAPIRRTVIVWSSTGSLNRTGPGRLHVTLARYWASLGFTVVRVDIGGCGDTIDLDPETASKVLAPVRAEELRAVVSWVRRWTGFDHLVVGGLCSGAFNAFHVALAGEALDDLLLINPGTFYLGPGETSVEETLATAHFLTRGFFNGRKWKLALTDPAVRRQGVQSVRKLFKKKPISGMRVLMIESIRNAARRLGLPVKATSVLATDLGAIIERGANVFLAFSSSEPAEKYFRTVGGAACAELTAGKGVDLLCIDGGDHVFASSGARQVLIERTTTYLEGRHPELTDAAASEAPSPTRRVSGSRGPLGLSAR